MMTDQQDKSPTDQYASELHEMVHNPTMQWMDHYYDDNPRGDRTLSPKVSQASVCAALRLWQYTFDQEEPRNAEEQETFNVICSAVCMGASLQAAVMDGELEFAEIEDLDDGTVQ